jgi:hypothetical protein
LDWLRVCKAHIGKNIQEIIKLVSEKLTSTGEETSFGHGFHGVEVCGYGSLTWRVGNDRKHEVLVDLPGQAVEYARTVLRVSDQELCQFFIDLGFKGKRWDGAIDCKDKRATPKFVFDQLDPEKDLACCEASRRTLIVSDDIHNENQIYGTTCYIGSRTSSRYMRVYDKVKEKLQKTGETIVDENGVAIEHLTRFEIECHDEAADFAMRKMAEMGVDCIKPIMRGWIDFKDSKSRKNCKRKHDAKRALWWERIIGDGVKLKPGLHRASTPERTKLWLEKGVAASVALARKYGAGEDFERAVEKSVERLNRVKEKQWAAWRQDRIAYRQHIRECEEIEREDAMIVALPMT